MRANPGGRALDRRASGNGVKERDEEQDADDHEQERCGDEEAGQQDAAPLLHAASAPIS